MKRFLLKTGFFTIGSLSIISDNCTLNINAKEPELIISLEQYNHELTNEELVKKYANIYGMNEDIIFLKLNELTGSFNNYNWLQNYSIYDNKYENAEIAILTTVRDIYKNSEKYELDCNVYEEDSKHESSKKYEDLLAYYSNLIGVNKEIALSISYAECGSNLDSANFINNNNPAGLGPYNYYDNIEQGIIEYLFFLKNTCGCNKDSDESFFYKIGPSYSGGDGKHWIYLTTSYYNNIISDYYYYVYDKDNSKVMKY